MPKPANSVPDALLLARARLKLKKTPNLAALLADTGGTEAELAAELAAVMGEQESHATVAPVPAPRPPTKILSTEAYAQGVVVKRRRKLTDQQFLVIKTLKAVGQPMAYREIHDWLVENHMMEADKEPTRKIWTICKALKGRGLITVSGEHLNMKVSLTGLGQALAEEA